MIRIRLLGGFSIEGPPGVPTPRLPQRRAGAALAVLAVCGDLGCTRERLIALLWPETDESSARHNLRDALHAIRRALGSNAVSSMADVVSLELAALTSDVQQFSAALNAGRLSEAVAAYRGPLLDGVHIDGAPEFERWVDDERARLHRECIEAVKRLAKAAEIEGRWDAASEWWARAVALDRYNTRFVVRRMVALARAGDRANAIIEGEAHCRLLKADLDLEPDEAFHEELRRIRNLGLGAAGFFTPAFPRPNPPETEP